MQEHQRTPAHEYTASLIEVNLYSILDHLLCLFRFCLFDQTAHDNCLHWTGLRLNFNLKLTCSAGWMKVDQSWSQATHTHTHLFRREAEVAIPKHLFSLSDPPTYARYTRNCCPCCEHFGMPPANDKQTEWPPSSTYADVEHVVFERLFLFYLIVTIHPDFLIIANHAIKGRTILSVCLCLSFHFLCIQKFWQFHPSMIVTLIELILFDD